MGQNVNGYRGETFEGNICTFADLLRLVADIPGIGRIRYTTSHPLEFNDDLIQCYRDLPQMVSHLHLPVQSGSNDVLQAMKRNHTIDVYIEKIKNYVQFALTCTYLQTLSLVSRVKLMRISKKLISLFRI